MSSISVRSTLSRLISALVVCIATVACQTTGNLVGTGNLTLAERVANNFENQYLKKPNAGFYFVSEDGRYARYNHCLEGAGKCDLGRFEFDALRSCEYVSKQKCYLFARGHKIVWDGKVSSSSGGSFKPKFLDLRHIRDAVLCNGAINRRTGHWELRSTYAPYVMEAKNRGLTEGKCAEISPSATVSARRAGNKVPRVPIGEFAFAPNFQLCAHALNQSREKPVWSQLYEYEPYVRELTKRGVSPQNCRDIDEAKRRVSADRRYEFGSDKVVCRQALDANWTPPWWGITYASIPYVHAAQARGLSVTDCQILLGGAAMANELLSGLSNAEICNQAVTSRQDSAMWSAGERYRYHIAEAKRRGMTTPKACMNAVFGAAG